MSLQLNTAQARAVFKDNGPLLVLAGAGSGKTRVIIEKIALFIEQKRFLPQHIFAITFTNKAAQEMRARIQERLTFKMASPIQISTFHRLGLSILEKNLPLTERKKGFSIFDAEETRGLLRDWMAQAGMTADPEDAKKYISLAKNQGISPSDASPEWAPVYAEYQHLLQVYNAFDFDDLLAEPVRLFQQYPALLQEWRSQVHYLLIDEYQDTNPIQYAFFKQLTGHDPHFTLVGDDDQSIYAFRGSNPENMALLSRDFPNLEVIKLEQNYRSTGHILQCANGLIAHNAHVFEKVLWSELGTGEPVQIRRFKDDTTEAEMVAQFIAQNQKLTGCSFSDFAILYRSKHQAYKVEEALRSSFIPYEVHGQVSFFNKPEVRDIMAYFRLIANPGDDPAFLRVINTPKRGIGHQTLKTLAQYAKMREKSLLHACQEFGLRTQLSDSAYQKLQSFHALMLGFRQDDDPKIEARFRRLLSQIDYESYLQSETNSKSAFQRKIKTLDELIKWLTRIFDKLEDKTIPAMLQRIMLIDLLDRQAQEQDHDHVQLMTLHAAKGLEFPHVYLIGFEEDILPHKNSVDLGTIDEERRLAYVGMTRAQRTLNLSFAESRMQYGVLSPTEPSRFLAELPEENRCFASSHLPPPVVSEKHCTPTNHWDKIKALLEKS